MNYSCPKCAAKIELDLSQIPAEGTVNKCPSCSARYLLNHESFAKRAYRKSGGINCVRCGNELDHSIHCPNCGVLYPDYFVAETPDAARKKARKIWTTFKGLDFSFKLSSKTDHKTEGYRPDIKTHAHEPLTSKKSLKSLLTKVSLVVVVILLAIGGTFYYLNLKAQRQYSANFFMTLYGIKVGTDLSINTCSKLSANWKAKTEAGQNFTPRISADDEMQLSTLKGKLDKIKQKLNETPPKFSKAQEKLDKLYSIFTNSYRLALTPSGNLSSFADSANKIELDFKQASVEFKANLPKELAEDLPAAKAKYRNLKDF